TVLPMLQKIEGQCIAATTASSVRSIIDTAREELRNQINGVAGGRDGTDSLPNPLATLATRPEMGAELRGLLAILYQVERELAPFRPNSKNSLQVAPRHLRVPACAPTADEAMLLWLRFMLSQLDQNTSLCVIDP